MTIHVSQDDIDQGAKGDSGNCPIAIAIERVLDKNRFSHVTVTPYWITLYPVKDVPTAKIDLPNVARFFIDQFDYGNKVYPFSFEISWD